MHRICKTVIIALVLFSGVQSWSKPDRFTAIDAAVRGMPQARSIQDVVQFIKSNSHDDGERARGAYVWIAENIAYDFNYLLRGTPTKTDAEGVFETRKTICAGYSQLYAKIAEDLGLQVKVINGFAKAYGYKPGYHFTKNDNMNHAWNAVKIDGKWRLLDATWGSGGVDNTKFVKKFNAFWFDTDPQLFAFNHFPDDTAWLLFDSTMTLADYEKAPFVITYNLEKISSEGFSTESILDYSKYMNLDQDAVFHLKAFRSAGFSRETVIEISKHFPLGYSFTNIADFIKIGGTSDDVLSYIRQGSMPGIYIPDGYTIQLIEYPRDNQVKIGNTYHLSVRIPDCDKTAFLTGIKYTNLKKDGDVFTGDITIKPTDDYLEFCVPNKKISGFIPVITWEINRKKTVPRTSK
jgi:hypothetical protein